MDDKSRGSERKKQETPETLFSEDEHSVMSSIHHESGNDVQQRQSEDTGDGEGSVVESLPPTPPRRRPRPQRTKQISHDMLPTTWFAVQTIEEAAAAALAKRTSAASVPPRNQKKQQEDNLNIPTEISFLSLSAQEALESERSASTGETPMDYDLVDRLTIDEEDFIDRSKRIVVRARPSVPQRTKREKRACFIKITFALLLTVFLFAPLIFRAGRRNSDDSNENKGTQQDVSEFDEDPFENLYSKTNPNKAYIWDNHLGSGGLNLTVVSALDSAWQPYFEEATLQWEAADALWLDVERAEYDYECTPQTKTLKVCNGDYGNTGWKGLNGIILNEDTRAIVSSSAKMNDYYLQRESISDYERRYIMCHEMGHGFGLPHWPEAGNCMADSVDTVDDPSGSEQPDQSNFDFLSNLYGIVGEADGGEVNGAVVTGQETPPLMGENDGAERRNLRGSAMTPSNKFDKIIPESVLMAYHAVVSDLMESGPSGRRLRKQKNGGEQHQSSGASMMERDLGEGFILQLHVISA